jgi:hypothetical protein
VDTLELPPVHRPPIGDVFLFESNNESAAPSTEVLQQYVHHQPHPYIESEHVAMLANEDAAALEFIDMPLDDVILHNGLVEFGFGGMEEGDKEKEEKEEKEEERSVVQSMYTSSDMFDSVLPQTMTHTHLAEFKKMTALLRHRHKPDFSANHFNALEQHFTRCFSLPNKMSFLVMETDRFETGRPDVYANQQAEKLFSVGLTQVQHIIMGIDSTRKVVDCLAQAAYMKWAVAHVPSVWVNTYDEHNNPCPRLVDIWLPRMVFNDTNFMVIVAPHGSVLLQNKFEAFHAPCHTPLLDQELY